MTSWEIPVAACGLHMELYSWEKHLTFCRGFFQQAHDAMVDDRRILSEQELSSGKHTKNYGKIHHFQWVNPLFRLGHVQ
jgi:hypothetical protein